MDNKELIWVDKKVAEEYKKMESDKFKLNLVNKVIVDRKKDFTYDIESLNDDLLRFKAFSLNYKTAITEAYEKQTEEAEKLFLDIGCVGDKLSNKTREATDNIKKIGVEIKELNRCLDKINTYKLESLLGLINKFNCMSCKDKEIFSLLLKHSEELS